MTSNVEQGIKAFFATKLVAVATDYGAGAEKISVTAATISGKKVQLIALTSNQPVAELWPAIVVKVTDAKVEVASLWTCNLEIAVCTPRNVEGFTDAHHRAFCAAVRQHMIFDNAADIAAALAGFGIAECNRWYEAGASDQHTDGRWITSHEYNPFGFSL